MKGLESQAKELREQLQGLNRGDNVIGLVIEDDSFRGLWEGVKEARGRKVIKMFP